MSFVSQRVLKSFRKLKYPEKNPVKVRSLGTGSTSEIGEQIGRKTHNPSETSVWTPLSLE